ncbi:type I-F CRISPR-associated endoribonuclease Cas6/Csy4 [Thaumasiovibrio sp. DFM-14]|uniref:type I-F CRISPR-associated endoribonuclease Cas6/Csy4 n=1 Tax=Thaumasiovibrio sp. DFM-14 TaxID=3384792 RepID=UPI0039A22B56
MSDLFYLTVKFLPEPRNNEYLALRCLKVLHGYCSSKGIDNLAASFPEWSEDTVGSRLTLVCTKSTTLNELVDQPYFAKMRAKGYFSISEPTSVPKEAPLAYFVRNQAIDDAFPKADARKIKRLSRRAAERGEVYQPYRQQDQAARSFSHYHTLKLSSKGNGQKFRLNIQMEPATKELSGKVTSYGLSNKTDKRFAVPLV